MLKNPSHFRHYTLNFINLTRNFSKSPILNKTNNVSTDSSQILPNKAKSVLKTILHGSTEAKLINRQIEKQTFSKMLARQNKLYRFEVHEVSMNSYKEYTRFVEDYYPKNMEMHGKLFASFSCLIGSLNKVYYIWEFESYSQLNLVIYNQQNDKDYQCNYLEKLYKFLITIETQVCLEFEFFNNSNENSVEDGIYELRSYLLKPGKLLEWEQNWKKGLVHRSKYCKPVGLWFSQLGSLNYVHHVWVYSNLEERKKNREEAWNESGWSETVKNTVPLIERLNAEILKPMRFSPLK